MASRGTRNDLLATGLAAFLSALTSGGTTLLDDSLSASTTYPPEFLLTVIGRFLLGFGVAWFPLLLGVLLAERFLARNVPDKS